VIARTGEPVAHTDYVWPTAPDGQATFPLHDGGWVLVTNSEWASSELLAAFGTPAEQAAALGGGVSAIRFARSGRIVDAYRILGGSNINCAGGPTPWGTWLSGEEWDLLGATQEQVAGAFGPVAAAYFFREGAERAGQIWECDPRGRKAAVALPALGLFQHEAAAVDPETNIVYLTEDQRDGLLYRFVPAKPRIGRRPDLSAGELQAARVADVAAALAGSSAVEWIPAVPANPAFPLRLQVPGATRFARGEGMWFDCGTVYFTTTGDNRVWAYECATATISVIYDLATAGPDAPLSGVDNITVHPRTGDVYVAEDGGNMELVTITSPDDPNGRVTAPFARFTPAAGVPQVGTEVTGPCFSPRGDRLYVSSQRGIESSSFPFPQRGITYEIRGPFRSRRRNAHG
jgi:secreted PhoX family phosphatase